MCNLLKGAGEAGRGVLGGSKLNRTGTDGWKARLYCSERSDLQRFVDTQ